MWSLNYEKCVVCYMIFMRNVWTFKLIYLLIFLFYRKQCKQCFGRFVKHKKSCVFLQKNVLSWTFYDIYFMKTRGLKRTYMYNTKYTNVAHYLLFKMKYFVQGLRWDWYEYKAYQRKCRSILFDARALFRKRVFLEPVHRYPFHNNYMYVHVHVTYNVQCMSKLCTNVYRILFSLFKHAL